MAWYRTEPKQLPKPMATQFTDAYLSLDSDKWNDERWLGTHELEIAWKRVLHYFDLHLNKLNYRPIECLFNSLFRLPTMKYQRSALLSLCDENPLWSVVPTQKESNMENASIWWRHNGLKDTMTAHVSFYAIYTLYYSNYITESESLQPWTKQCSRKVGMLAPRWFLCYRWVRFLRTITPSVKSNVTTTVLGVEGGHPRWQRD